MTMQPDDRNGSGSGQGEFNPPADPSNRPIDPGRAQRATAARAASRSRMAARQDRARHQIESGGIDDPARTQTGGAGADLTTSLPDRKREQVGDEDAMTPQIKAARRRSAELLREAVELVVCRTHDS